MEPIMLDYEFEDKLSLLEQDPSFKDLARIVREMVDMLDEYQDSKSYDDLYGFSITWRHKCGIKET